MSTSSIDNLVTKDNWSDLRQFRELPNIDLDRLHNYRIKRLREEIRKANVAALIMVNPISLRYAVDYSTYALFQSRIPSTYLIMSEEGPTIIFGALADTPLIDRSCPANHISFFESVFLIQH